jgi:membrane-bound metal-dependent hydrolase YbcI (DUF457 family)
MFVGHATLAFAVAALGARAAGSDSRRATALGAAAAAFALAPDVDIVYALVGFLGAGTDPMALAEGFWGASTRIHRGVTHSLVLAPVVAMAAATRGRVGVGVAGGVAALALFASGALASLVAGLFAVTALAAGAFADRAGLAPTGVAAAALVGLLTHPFGDLFTGTAPALLYPFAADLTRLAPFADPTLNLLLAFGVELAAVWAGVLVAADLRGVSVRARVRPRATLGAGYVLLVPLLRPPTLDTSYHFVLSVVAVGGVGLGRDPDRVGLALTGLAAVTAAWAAYAAGYPLL